jgi:hypothetical protein
MVTEVVSRVATTIESSKHQESTNRPVLDPTGAFLVLTIPSDRARSHADVLFGEGDHSANQWFSVRFSN